MASTRSRPRPPQTPAPTPSDARARRAARGQNPAMADRRDQILKVAAVRFAAAGFEATTVRQIADDVNILSGSLYHHFATKEEMLHDIVRAPVERIRAATVQIAALPASAEARLATLIRAELAELVANHEVHAILYAERKLFRRNPDFRYVLDAKREAYDCWQRLLEEGIAEGAFVGDGNIHLMVTTLQRLLNTGADLFATEEGSFLDFMGTLTPDKLSDFVLRFILRALRTPERAGLPFPAPLELPAQ